MKNSCGKHNKATFTSFDVIPSKLFTFKNVEIGNGFSMCIDVKTTLTTIFVHLE